MGSFKFGSGCVLDDFGDYGKLKDYLVSGDRSHRKMTWNAAAEFDSLCTDESCPRAGTGRSTGDRPKGLLS